jgi:menaquinone-dependent protoporphyrinogen oxidase
MGYEVLVTYATKHGATGEITGAIDKVLREQGITTTLRNVVDVEDPAAYDAIVVGTAVYVIQWRNRRGGPGRTGGWRGGSPRSEGPGRPHPTR